jgi:hypothetical protein
MLYGLMKIIIISAFSFCLQAQNLSMELASSNASCIGNGSITVNMTNLNPDGQLEINFFLLPNTTNPFRTYSTNNAGNTSIGHIENSLPAGSYFIVASQATVSGFSNISDSIQIANTAIPLTFSTTQNAICNAQNLIVNTSSGNPMYYELRDLQGNEIVPPQTSHIITNVLAGTYLLVVTDICGNSSGLSVQITTPVANYLVHRNGQQYRFDNLSHCDSIAHVSRLIFNGLNIIPAERFPLQINYQIAKQNGDTISSSYTWHSNTNNFQNLNIPLYAGESYNFIVTGVDACGTTFSRTDNIITEPKSLFRVFPASCGSKYLMINGILRHFGPIQIKFISYPPEFHPGNYNTHFQTPDSSAIFPTIPGSILFGGPNSSVPSGSYTIEISSCGRTETLTVNVVNDNQYQIVAVRSYVGCETNNGSIHLQMRLTGSNSQADDFSSVSITSAPTSFLAQYGSLPFDVSSYIASNGQFYMNSLPPGNYTVSGIGTCGVMASGSFVIHQKQINFNKAITHSCGFFSLNTTMVSTLGNAIQYLQRYYPEHNQWGHPITGALYTEGTPLQTSTAIFLSAVTNGNGINTSYGSALGISSFGLFRIVVQYSFHSNGTIDQINCRETLDEFEVETFGISLNDYFVFNCINGGSELSINATGIPPLNYSIIEINHVTLSAPILNGENPVFSNLQDENYKVRIQDQCGNVLIVNVQMNSTISPIITPSDLCEGVNGSLTVWGLGLVDIAWQKVPSAEIISYGNTLNFEPFSFNTDSGIYNATITSPSGTCAPQIISFQIDTLPSLPNAGIGQTIVFLESTANTINLFDLLSPPYDNYGYWVENSSSGHQNGNLFFAENASPGTYVFDYIVDGSCSGSDTAQVVVQIISEALISNPDNIELNCTVSSSQLIGNVMTNDLHFANPVVFEQYIIETIIHDPSNAITLDNSGNIWIHDNASFSESYQLSYKITYLLNPDIYSTNVVTVNLAPNNTTPVFLNNPLQDTTVSCDNIPSPAMLLAQNDCGSVPVVFNELVIQGNCSNEFTLIRSWTASTSNGTAVSHTQYINVIDTTSPQASSIPGIFVLTANLIPEPDINWVQGFVIDNCGNVDVTFIQDQSNNQSCPETIIRTYRITDECGNFNNIYQNIIVHDTVAPWASNLPPITVNCIDDVPAIETSIISDASDNVQLVSIVHFGDESNNQICPEVISRTYRLFDACNNFYDVVQLIIIHDTIAPQAIAPSTIFASCPDDIPLPNTNLVLYPNDNCGEVTIEHSFDIPINLCYGGQIQRTFTISDQCQNSSQVTQIINFDIDMTNNVSFSSSHPSRCNNSDGSITIFGLLPNQEYLVSYNFTDHLVITNASGTIIIENLPAGTYSNFMFQPNSCSFCIFQSDSIIVLHDPQPPVISAGADISLCEGNQVILTAYNPQNALISWNNGVSDGLPFQPNSGSHTYILTAMILECYT